MLCPPPPQPHGAVAAVRALIGCDWLRRMTLDQAQLNKIHYVIQKAGLKETDEVVELGCGWGGFAVEAAATVGCKIRAYNLSVEQVPRSRSPCSRHAPTTPFLMHRCAHTMIPAGGEPTECAAAG